MILPHLLPIATVLLPLIVGCSQHRATISTAPTPPSQHLPDQLQQHMQAPFVLTLAGPQQPAGNTLELTATLHAQLGQPMSVELALSLPRGATLVDGLPKQTVPLSPSQPSVTLAFRLALTGPLQQPIRLRATLPSDGTMGAVAEREYPTPPSAVPPARSVPQIVGGLPLSTPIEVIPSH